jgi:hypothetical protein
MSRTYQVITVCKDHFTKEFKINVIKNLLEQEAKTYIRVAIQDDGFGVMLNRTFPSAYPEYTKVTKKICTDYITAMQSEDFKKIMKAYDKLERIGLKATINF